MSIFGRAVSDRQDDTLSSGQRLQPDHLGLWTMAPPPWPAHCQAPLMEIALITVIAAITQITHKVH